MEDLGFAVLTGGRRCPSRHSVGAWRRHLPWYEVDAFCRRSSPWHLIEGDAALVSYDEHTIPRWTHKFHIGKGYVTTRNKYMRCEKLFYGYDVLAGRYLAVRATPGDTGLIDLAVPLTRQTLRRGQPRYLHALFDAGAGKSDAGVRALWDLADEYHPRLDVTMRACRYPHRVGVVEGVAARSVHGLHRAGAVCRCPRQGDPPGRDDDGAQGRKRRAGGADDHLPGDGARAEEGPLAPAVHDRQRRGRAPARC